ncbi:hypothetical protein HZH66_001387 [Vespula vulgaris]|uniref:Uncharacterized protein n=1 Tax=Vespula vulgaris TaxID=7454 RepID=A0A834KSZ6_VESVU|nr:hypothetical protein HZH66_001387 [Vespula vulgaris]
MGKMRKKLEIKISQHSKTKRKRCMIHVHDGDMRLCPDPSSHEWRDSQRSRAPPKLFSNNHHYVQRTEQSSTQYCQSRNHGPMLLDIEG